MKSALTGALTEFLSMNPTDTPNQVIEGKPTAFLESMEPNVRRTVIHYSLAVLSEARIAHREDAAVLVGLATMEAKMVSAVADTYAAVRKPVVYSQSAPGTI